MWMSAPPQLDFFLKDPPQLDITMLADISRVFRQHVA